MIYLIIVLILALALIIISNFQFRLFYPSSKKLRILEYHSISTNGFEDQITISKEKIRAQFEYLKKNNYQTLWFSDIEEMRKNKQSLPPKSIVLTFDDGFLDNYTELYPMLKEFEFKAVCFMVLGRIGKNINWSGRFVSHDTMLMSKEQMGEVASHIEFGYHTLNHDNYTHISFDEIEKDLQSCREVIEKEKLQVFPALAYTYGRYYRKKDEKQEMFFKILEKHGIKYGLRIGNRINVFPFKSPYEVQRIDIRGFDTMKEFKTKIVLGRTTLF